MLGLITATKQIQSSQNPNSMLNNKSLGKFLNLKNRQMEDMENSILNDDPSLMNMESEFGGSDNSIPPIMKALDRQIGKSTKYIFSKSKLFDGISFQETKLKEILYEQYRANVLMQMIISAVSIVTGLMATEIQKINDYTPPQVMGMVTPTIIKSSSNLPAIQFSLYLCFACTIYLWVLIIADYFYYYRILSQHKKISEEILRTQPLAVLELVCTLLFFGLHPNPWLEGYKYNIKNEKFDTMLTYTWNSTFMAVSICRLWFPVKFYLVNSEYYKPRSKRVCEMNKVENNLFFTLKASMQGSAFEIYGLFFLMGIVFFTITIRIFEMELDSHPSVSCKFGNYWDTIWMVIITMLTVGYGDFYPSTVQGRGLAILSAIIGVLLISMLIVTITNMISFTYNEKVVFELIQRLQLKDEKDTYAAKLVSQYCNLFKVMKSKDQKDEKLKEQLREKFLISLCDYKEKNKQIYASYPPISNYELINTDLDGIESSLAANSLEYDEIKKNLDELNKLF